MKVLVIVECQEAARTGEVEAVIEILDHENPDDVFAHWARDICPSINKELTTTQICERNESYAWNVAMVKRKP